MPSSRNDHAASAAAISLIALCAGVACLIPPLNERFVDTPLWVVALGLVITVSLVLHLIFVGMLAKSLGRSPGWTVALALLTLPVGSIVGLVLLEWQASQRKRDQPTGAA